MRFTGFEFQRLALEAFSRKALGLLDAKIGKGDAESYASSDLSSVNRENGAMIAKLKSRAKYVNVLMDAHRSERERCEIRAIVAHAGLG